MKFILYFICRILKAPLFWVAVPPFKRWKNIEDSIKKDLKFFLVALILGLIWVFIPWKISLIITIILLLIYVAVVIDAKKSV